MHFFRTHICHELFEDPTYCPGDDDEKVFSTDAVCQNIVELHLAESLIAERAVKGD